MTASNKPPFAGEVRRVRLGELISKAKVERCGDRDFPVLSMTMHDGIVRQTDRFKKAIASKDVSLYKVVRPNQLVVGFPIDEGVIYVQGYDCPGIMSPAYNVWDIDSDRIVPAYLELALHSPRSMAYYAERMRGTTARRRSITSENLTAMQVPLPSLDEQLNVISTLGSVKKLASDCSRTLSLLDELVKSRFVEMFEPTEWPTFPAGSVLLNMRNGVSPSKEGLCHARVLTLSAITQGSFDAESWKEGAYPSDPPREKRVSAGEFYICRGNGNRDLVGAGEYSDTDLPDLVFPDTMIAARINFDLISAAYLRYAWGRPAIRRQIESRARTTNGTFKINQRMLSEVLLPLPPLSLQKEFAAFAAEVAKSQVAVRQQIERLQTLYDSLAQEYFG